MKRAAIHTTRRSLLQAMLAARVAPVLVPARLLAAGQAVRSDTLCQLAPIAVKQARKVEWDPKAERFANDEAANAMLQARAFRGDWKLKEV